MFPSPPSYVPEDILLQFSKQTPHRTKIKGLTVLIPIRGVNRNISLKLNIAHLLSQNTEPVEILIVEEDKAPLIQLSNFGHYPQIKKIFLNSTQHFNKSRTINQGVKNATYEAICMLDVDLLVPQDFLLNISQTLDQYDAYFPIRDIFYLNEMPLGNFSTQTRLAYGSRWSQKVRWFCHGGSVCFNKKKFIEIGGMDESFVGHGSEDTEFYKRAKALLKVQDNRMFTTLHMPHPMYNTGTDTNLARLKTILNGSFSERATVLQKALLASWSH